MTTTEDRLRQLLQGLADDAQPAPLLERLEQHAPVVRRQRRMVALATAAMVAMAAGSVALGQLRPEMPQPTRTPPEVLRLGPDSRMDPGPVMMAVTLPGLPIRSQDVVGHFGEAPVFVLPDGQKSAVAVPATDQAPILYNQRLSRDGSYVIRSAIAGVGLGEFELVDLRTGRVKDLGFTGEFADLSPDNQTLALYGWDDPPAPEDGVLRLVDVSSRKTTVIRRTTFSAEFAHELGWSPDGTRLAVNEPDSLVVVDREGEEQTVISDAHLVNGSQSWSPDGRAVLVWLEDAASFAVQPVDGSDATLLTTPPDAVRPLGWAGNRVIWLAGSPGSQRLVATDQKGEGAETWLRLEVDRRPVVNVTWSRALSG